MYIFIFFKDEDIGNGECGGSNPTVRVLVKADRKGLDCHRSSGKIKRKSLESIKKILTKSKKGPYIHKCNDSTIKLPYNPTKISSIKFRIGANECVLH